MDKVRAFLRSIANYGNEDPDSPDFSYVKAFIRVLATNLIAGCVTNEIIHATIDGIYVTFFCSNSRYIAYRLTMEFFPPDGGDGNMEGEQPAIEDNVNSAWNMEF